MALNNMWIKKQMSMEMHENRSVIDALSNIKKNLIKTQQLA